MITHIVLFKLKEMGEDEKKAICTELKESLESLSIAIPQVVTLKVAVNRLYEGKNHDLVLLSEFKDEADLEIYRQHPAHQKVVQRIGEVTLSRAAIDIIQ